MYQHHRIARHVQSNGLSDRKVGEPRKNCPARMGNVLRNTHWREIFIVDERDHMGFPTKWHYEPEPMILARPLKASLNHSNRDIRRSASRQRNLPKHYLDTHHYQDFR